jgi:hypothetical protein
MTRCRFDLIPTEHARLTNSKVNLKHKHLFITGCSNSKLSTITDHEKSIESDFEFEQNLSSITVTRTTPQAV